MDPRLKDQLFRFWTSVHRVVFTSTKGRVFGRAAGMPVVLLRTTGRKSGEPRETMLTSPVQDGDSIMLIASYGGDSRHPAWYLNLKENPDVTVTTGGRTRPMRARTATPEERASLWPRAVAKYRGYAGYQKRTDREIPVVILEPR